MTPWIKEPIVMVDTETTGLHANARIVEMASVLGCDGKLTQGRSMRLDPGEPIQPGATRVHGITDAMVVGAKTFAQVATLVLARLDSGLPAAYGAPFDRRRFEHELGLVGMVMRPVVWIDPLPWVRKLDRAKGNTLGDACRRHNIPLPRAHSALHDATAALQLLYAIAPKLPADLAELRGETERARAEQDAKRAEYEAKKAASQEAIDKAARELAEQAPTNDAAPEAKGA